MSSFAYLMINIGLVIVSAVVPAIPKDKDSLKLEDFNDLNGALSLFFFMGIFPLLVGYKLLNYNLPVLTIVSVITFAMGVAQFWMTLQELFKGDKEVPTLLSYGADHGFPGPDGVTTHSFAHVTESKREFAKKLSTIKQGDSQYYPFFFLAEN